MKTFITGAVAVVALVAGWLVMAPRPVSAQDGPFISVFGSGAWIGVTAREVTADDASKAKLAQPVGVLVESVSEGGPAATAGVRAGDIVLDFGGERIRSVRQFTRVVQESALRRAVPVVVVRGTERLTLDVVPDASAALQPQAWLRRGEPLLRVFPREREQQPRDFNFDIGPELRRRFQLDAPQLGVSVTPLGDQLAEYFGVKTGVLVASVGENSTAAEAGLKAGDVITAIDGRGVTSAADIADALRRAPPGEGIDISVTRDRKSLMLKAMPTPAPTASGRRGLPV